MLYLPRLPTPTNLRFARAMRVLDAVVTPLIAARRTAPPREDLLGMDRPLEVEPSVTLRPRDGA